MSSGQILQIFIIAVPAIFAVTLHEVAHGWVANRLGDPTAANEGRLSLNPLRHVDPIGTVLVPLVLYLSAGVFFGWAKPVPVNWRNLRHTRRDIALVAVAGPGANLLMILGWFTMFQLTREFYTPGVGDVLIYMCWAGIMFNATIMLINLVPIPPLDGSRIVTAALPSAAARIYNRIEPFGLLVFAALLFTGVLASVLGPALDWVQGIMSIRIG